MRLSLTVVDGSTGRRVDASSTSTPTQPAADLVPAPWSAARRAVHDSFARRVPLWVDGVEVDLRRPPPARQESTAGRCSPSSSRPTWSPGQAPAGVAELRVVSGPGAGRIHRLPLGATVVGNGATGWSLPDLRLPADALSVDVALDGTVRVSPAAGLGARLDGEDLEDEGADWPRRRPPRRQAARCWSEARW